MTLGTHAVVGAAVVVAVSGHPILGAVLAFASHFILDAIPHWDYAILSESANPLGNSKFSLNSTFVKDLARIGLDACIGLAIVIFFFYRYRFDLLDQALIGAVFAMLPDPLQFAYRLFPKEPLVSLQKFHIWIHAKIRLNDKPVLGPLLQVILVCGVVSGLYVTTFRPYAGAAVSAHQTDESCETCHTEPVVGGIDNSGKISGNLAAHPPEMPTSTANMTPYPKPPQFVVLAFDGSKSLTMWKETLDFSKEMEEKNTPVHFTYFVNGVYFLTDASAGKYKGPGHASGTSAIGFSESNSSIEQRVAYVNRAKHEGHEIGSHANGHWNGQSWTRDEWVEELEQLPKLLGNVAENNPGVDPELSIDVKKKDLVGFRAPELGLSKNLYDVLSRLGFRYDASQVVPQNTWPWKDELGTWHFPLSTMRVGDSWTISMDYNFYILQTQAIDRAQKGTELYEHLFNDSLQAYEKYFSNNYYGNRAPVYMGNHFSKWNDGLYWEVMKAFAREVCGKPEVKCVTYKDLANFMDTTTADMRASYQKAYFKEWN